MADLERLLADPAIRLVTVLGSGGMGKTRLALEVASSQLERFEHGVYLVSLGPLESPAGIVPTVARALQFSFYEGGTPEQQLCDYLRGKQVLLVLDNFEHLLAGVDIVAAMLEAAPGLKVLATSRAGLNLQAEQLYPIAGIAYPGWETPEDAAGYSAVKLFVQSARRAQPGFELVADDLIFVSRICRLVQGMPLGILLAAGWVELLTPAEIAAEISQNLDFLETALRDVPERQRSMRAVFDHSWNLLTEREREVFQALSVFRGGFIRQAAQAVAGASLRELMALVNKSLLQRTSTGRYEMHELLRGYAAEKLEASEEADTARNAHSAYYADFLHQRAVDLTGRKQLDALDEIEADFENVRAAWNWAIGQKDYNAVDRMQTRLGFFCHVRRFQEGKELTAQAREMLAPGPGDEPHPIWGRILVYEEAVFGPHQVDRAQIERGFAIVQKNDDKKDVAFCLWALGNIALKADNYVEAKAYFEKSLQLNRSLNDSFNIVANLYELAETHRMLGQPDQAIKFARQSLEMSREIGDKYWAAQALANTGVIALYTGNYAEAESHLHEANTIYRKMSNRVGIGSSNVELSKLAFLRGDFEKTKALAGEALEIAIELGNKRVAQSALDLDSLAAMALGEKIDEHPDEQEPIPIPDIPPTIDRFEVKELLWVGGSRAVYRAHDPTRGHDVVIKTVDLEAIRKSDWLSKMFRNEIKMMASLAHPAIEKFYCHGETGDHAYVVKEYIDGKTLWAMIYEQEGFLPEQNVLEWAIQICDALTYVHGKISKLLIERDLKPSNVMVDHNGRVHLIDLNIVEDYRPGRELPMMSTELWSPPEQYIGYSDARSDIYTLGATLHYLLTRGYPDQEKPFSSHEAPPRSLNPAISEELEAVILKAVEYKAEDRYQSAEEMKTALLACL